MEATECCDGCEIGGEGGGRRGWKGRGEWEMVKVEEAGKNAMNGRSEWKIQGVGPRKRRGGVGGVGGGVAGVQVHGIPLVKPSLL